MKTNFNSTPSSQLNFLNISPGSVLKVCCSFSCPSDPGVVLGDGTEDGLSGGFRTGGASIRLLSKGWVAKWGAGKGRKETWERILPQTQRIRNTKIIIEKYKCQMYFLFLDVYCKALVVITLFWSFTSISFFSLSQWIYSCFNYL